MGGGSQTTRTEPWDAQKPYLKYGMGEAQRMYTMGVPDYYSGKSIAGFDPAQEAAQAYTLGYTKGTRPAEMQKAAETQGMQLMGGDVDYSSGPFGRMATALGDQAKTQLTSNVLPGIRQQMVQYQPGGSSRGDIVQANAIAAANQQMTNKLAEMYGGAYTQAQGMRPGAVGMYPSLMAAPLGISGAMEDVGAARQDMTQRGLDEGVARYKYDATKGQQALTNYMAGISGDYGSTTQQPGPSGLQTLGTIASIASMFSDERLKEGVEQIGVHKGFNIYEYNYIWSPKKWIGVIAQEVEKIMPEAVIKINGYRLVNYGKLFGAT